MDTRSSTGAKREIGDRSSGLIINLVTTTGAQYAAGRGRTTSAISIGSGVFARSRRPLQAPLRTRAIAFQPEGIESAPSVCGPRTKFARGSRRREAGRPTNRIRVRRGPGALGRHRRSADRRAESRRATLGRTPPVARRSRGGGTRSGSRESVWQLESLAGPWLC